MSVQAIPKVVVPSKAVASGVESQFTSVALTVVGSAVVSNASGAPVTFGCFIPTSGGAGASNRVMPQRTLAAGEAYRIVEIAGQVLEVGNSIVTEASAAGLTLRISGVEYSTTA